ncbi:MAG: hypothetical protein ACE5JR_05885 [Gemmatimonadota bacterium]
MRWRGSVLQRGALAATFSASTLGCSGLYTGGASEPRSLALDRRSAYVFPAPATGARRADADVGWTRCFGGPAPEPIDVAPPSLGADLPSLEGFAPIALDPSALLAAAGDRPAPVEVAPPSVALDNPLLDEARLRPPSLEEPPLKPPGITGAGMDLLPRLDIGAPPVRAPRPLPIA